MTEKRIAELERRLTERQSHITCSNENYEHNSELSSEKPMDAQSIQDRRDYHQSGDTQEIQRQFHVEELSYKAFLRLYASRESAYEKSQMRVQSLGISKGVH